MDTKNELWKDIKDYEWAYQVSNFGRVRSKERVDIIGHPWHSRIIKPYPQKTGYLGVSLSNGNGKAKKFRVHRLVAKAFVNNPNGYNVVNHIDENVKNNKADNLEWCTTKYNIHYGHRGEKQGKSIRNNSGTIRRLKRLAKGQRKPVIQKDTSGKIIKHWPSISSTKKGGFIGSCVSDCCLGKQKIHQGYKWSFE